MNLEVYYEGHLKFKKINHLRRDDSFVADELNEVSCALPTGTCF
jgi:hypothetical protein